MKYVDPSVMDTLKPSERMGRSVHMYTCMYIYMLVKTRKGVRRIYTVLTG